MRIAVWPVGNIGSGWFRQLFAAQAIRDAGLAEVVEDWSGPQVAWSGYWEGDYPPADVKVLAIKSYDADVVILQRPALRHRVDLIPHLQAQGIRVVVDVDDLFDAIPRGNVARSSYQQAATRAEHVDRACQLADVVTCSTPALVKRYGYGKGRLLRNLVPESYLSIGTMRVPNSVGWAGMVGTHPEDLESTRGGVAKALRGTDWSFCVVGSGGGVRRGLKLDSEPTAWGWQPFDEYAEVMARLEVGIVPLANTAFNYAKSWLKASEFAALGVPVVMSPTPENIALNQQGVGLVAGSPSAWERRLRQLFRSPEYRADLAGKGREVMARLTYTTHVERWLSAWTAASRKKVA